MLLALVLLVLYVLFGHSRVAGPSMLPTLRDGDYILVTKGLSQPRRGDVVVLETTEAGRPTELVKRIVALAGDRVHIAGDFALVNSRYVGPFNVAQIQGRVVAVYAPVGRIGLVAGP
jgi:signal peptidase I